MYNVIPSCVMYGVWLCAASESSEGQCNCFGSGKEEADGAVITSNYFVSRAPRLGLGPLPLSGRGQELLIKYLRENIFEDFIKITPARL